MIRNYRKDKMMYYPIIALNIYMVFTFAIYLLGPIKYATHTAMNTVLLVLYLSFFLFTANIVYRYAICKNNFYVSEDKIEVNEKNGVRFAKISILYTLLLQTAMFVEYQLTYGKKSFSISRFFTLAADAYLNTEYQYTISNWIQSYTYFFVVSAITLGIVYWDKLEKRHKVFYIASIALVVIRNVLYNGEQKNIIDILIYMMIGLALKYCIKQKNSKTNGKRIVAEKKKQKILILIVLLIAMFFIIGFLNSRVSSWEKQYNATAMLQSGMQVDYDNLLIRYLPNNLKRGISFLLLYISHGYEGLALSLSLPFEWSVFMGTSWRFQSDFLHWFNLDNTWFAPSYPVRVEKMYGYRSLSQWHTVFPWFASDFTFVGAVIIVCCILYIYGKKWKESIENKNPISMVWVSQFAIMWVHITGTNYLFIKREFMTSIVLLCIVSFFYNHVKFVFGRY